MSGITVGLQQLGQPSADAYHQLPSLLSVSPENPDLLGGTWNSPLPLLRLDPYLSRAFRVAPPHLSSPWMPLETDLLPSPEGVPSGYICRQETLEKEVHLEKCLSELIGDVQPQVGGNQILAPSPRGLSFNSPYGASNP